MFQKFLIWFSSLDSNEKFFFNLLCTLVIGLIIGFVTQWLSHKFAKIRDSKKNANGDTNSNLISRKPKKRENLLLAIIRFLLLSAIRFLNYLKFKIRQLHEYREDTKRIKKHIELMAKCQKGEITKKEFFESNPGILTIISLKELGILTQEDCDIHHDNKILKPIRDSTKKIEESNKRNEKKEQNP